MTIEQRLSRLEDIAGINELPTNGRQGKAYIFMPPGTASANSEGFMTDQNPPPYIIRKNDHGDIEEVAQKSGWVFNIGSRVRSKGNESCGDFKLLSFDECTHGVFATIYTAGLTLTVPLSDLIPLTTGGASHNWAANHGVKDWEITAFRSTRLHDSGGGMQHNVNSNTVLKVWLTGDCSVKTGHWEIYSVRRADGTVWKLGDEVKIKGAKAEGIIETFFRVIGENYVVGNERMAITLKDQPGLSYSFMDISAPSGKEWEIVELKEKNGPGLIEYHMVGDNYAGMYDIWKVKRISDSALFTIGDRINYPNLQHSPDGCVIHHFTISDGEIFVNNHQNGTPHTRIKDWINWPVKQPIFTTADGKDIFDNSEIVFAWSSLGAIRDKSAGEAVNCVGKEWYALRFNAEAAYEKWLWSQPILSLDMLTDCPDKTYINSLEQYVKDKLAKK